MGAAARRRSKAGSSLVRRLPNSRASFSPDGRWIAYASNESGLDEVYVRPFVAEGPSGAPALAEGNGKSPLAGRDFSAFF
jgi:WD40-like Beta Propeller Repeat